jgi:hypothetical protein
VSAPAGLLARSGDGTSQALVKAGASLPAAAKIVFGTSKPGQDALVLDLLEDPGVGEAPRLVAQARFALPRGLPANTWVPIEVQVGADLRVRAEARENLRRIRVSAAWDESQRSALHFVV